jgi:hypothetical protein
VVLENLISIVLTYQGIKGGSMQSCFYVLGNRFVVRNSFATAMPGNDDQEGLICARYTRS